MLVPGQLDLSFWAAASSLMLAGQEANRELREKLVVETFGGRFGAILPSRGEPQRTVRLKYIERLHMFNGCNSHTLSKHKLAHHYVHVCTVTVLRRSTNHRQVQNNEKSHPRCYC